MTKEEYKKYQEKFNSFLLKNNIYSFSPVQNSEPYFSKSPCNCCGTSLYGNREKVSAFQEKTKEILFFECCQDCIYYAAYGQLDDMTMIEIEKD
jgi:hypothetical protein